MRWMRHRGQAIVELSFVLPTTVMALVGLFWLAGVFVRYQVARVHIVSLCEVASYSYDPANRDWFKRYPPQYWRAEIAITPPYLPPVTFRSLGWGRIDYVLGTSAWAYAVYNYDPSTGRWVLSNSNSWLPPSAPPARSRIDCYLYEPIIQASIPFFGTRTFYINYRYTTYSKWGG